MSNREQVLLELHCRVHSLLLQTGLDGFKSDPLKHNNNMPIIIIICLTFLNAWKQICSASGSVQRNDSSLICFPRQQWHLNPNLAGTFPNFKKAMCRKKIFWFKICKSNQRSMTGKPPKNMDLRTADFPIFRVNCIIYWYISSIITVFFSAIENN